MFYPNQDGEYIMKNNKLMRSQTDRMCLGVAGGLAEYMNIDPVIIRLLFVLTTVFANGLGLLVYLVLALVMADETVCC